MSCHGISTVSFHKDTYEVILLSWISCFPQSAYHIFPIELFKISLNCAAPVGASGEGIVIPDLALMAFNSDLAGHVGKYSRGFKEKLIKRVKE